MALRSPEQALEDAYEDGLRAANAHGFQINFSPELGFNHEYERQVGKRRTNTFSFWEMHQKWMALGHLADEVATG